MKVLVACEFSGRIRNAFAKRGHEAWSCDLLPSEMEVPMVHPIGKDTKSWGWEFHYQGDVKWILEYGWDLVIAHPPCTHLAVSGARWFKDKQAEQKEAIEFFMSLANLEAPRIAIENPIGIMSTVWRKPDQIIQPWMFGHGETKATCLWLKNLPLLQPTNIVEGREARIHRMPPSPDRWKERSRTYSGIAQAMASQWG